MDELVKSQETCSWTDSTWNINEIWKVPIRNRWNNASYVCFSFATHQFSSPKIGGEDTSISLHQSLRFIHKTNERKLNSLCKTFAFNGGVGSNPLRDTDDYSAIDESGQSLLEYCSLNDCCTGGSGQECRDWSPDPQVTYEMCPYSCHGDDSCTGIASDSAAGTVVSIQSGSCHEEGSCHRIAKSSPQVLNIRIEENSCLG
ncbi:predicted protein [Chaetoceros tenuissimus]|uniref:Uncharacterized protein n=1 Tax=Chaetoceros tenuissimus TaxID=426638 RepID=A0AAD3CEU8_9STRA|nr:predicted protein [Chaetoceros tenuissimus]